MRILSAARDSGRGPPPDHDEDEYYPASDDQNRGGVQQNIEAPGLGLEEDPFTVLRDEVRLYLIHNNVEFSSGYATRYGISLGYSFGGR